MEPQIKIDMANVKVMRSHDYCHFEVNLGSSSANTPEQVDELRKTAARLADKAVQQYKIAKREHAEKVQELNERRWERQRVEELESKAETDRTPEEQARIKAYRDAVWASNHEYDYQDDWRSSDDQDDEG